MVFAINKNTCKFILTFLCFVLFAAFNITNAKTIRLGIYNQEPDVFIKQDGSPGGILGELINTIAIKENWQLNTKSCDWYECIQLLRNNEIDILPDMFMTPGRLDLFEFHKEPAFQTWSQIYSPKNTKINLFNDLNGKTIAVLQGSAQYEFLNTTISSLGIRAKLHTVNELEKGFKLVQDGLADVVAADYLYGELTSAKYNLVATPIVFLPVNVFFASNKGHHVEILKTIDDYLVEWKRDYDSVYYQIIRNWQNPILVKDNSNLFLVAVILFILFSLALAFAMRYKKNLYKHRIRLMHNEKRLDTILGSVDALIYIKDKNLRYIYANQKVASFFDVPIKNILKQHNRDFLDADLYDETIKTIDYTDKQALNQERRITLQESFYSSVTDKSHTFLTVKVPLRNSNGDVEGICAILTDITDRVQVEQKVHRLSFYDTLTDLPNRQMLLSRLRQTVDLAHKTNMAGALLIIDIDGFKKINDTRGYAAGDKILQAVAHRLVSNTRERDTVSRISGDEYIVLLTQLGDDIELAVKRAAKIAEKLRASISDDPIVINHEQCILSASVGITMLHKNSGNNDDVMREADLATLKAKQSGGNCSFFYEQDIQRDLENRMWLEKELSSAINTDQIQMYVQPQFDKNDNITGAELLARWQHPERGFISPAEFIPLAEESGLINYLTDYSLEIACNLLLHLQSKNRLHPISINLSPKRLMDSNFVHVVRNMLGKTGVDGRYLVFEITETFWLEDQETLLVRLNELNDLGIKFAIDDFGTGYSNFAYINSLPIYELKIDQSLIRGIPDESNNSVITRLILAMAKELKLRAVAEGVEYDVQAEFLWQYECDAVQGYLKAKPMPISKWLEQF